ncbi:MAG TPA: hypothetical protein VFZ58_00300 [Candidatus Saccharimonadales bacterium]
MSKDVIYIDTEDDITSIIDRIKTAKADIVALVPPKRIGVLQSVVNLKLLKRAATAAKKHVVLITNDTSLASLAGGVKIPTAKNLQSRPEIAAISALEVDNNDVINGEELPIGEMNDAMGQTVLKPAAPPTAQPGEPPLSKAVPLKKNGKNPLKVPDFLKFRKKLFIIAGAALALIIFIWWAFWLAPSLTVAITAKTTIANVSRNIVLDPAALQTDANENIVKPVVQQLKKTNSVDFDATGKKDVGEKATGTVQVRNCDSSTSFVIPAGTLLTAASGQRFNSATAVSVPGFSGSASACRTTGSGAGNANVAIAAETFGPEYNIGPANFTIAGVGGDVYASSQAATSGGSKRTITVVSDADVEKAKQQLGTQDAAAVKEELAKQFKKEDYRLIEESFKTDTGQPAVNPAIGQETAKAKLTVETTYTMTALHKRDLGDILNIAVREQIKAENQEDIYDNGANELKFKNFQTIESGKATVTLSTTGYIGTKIDQEALKEQMVGKRYGDIEALVNQNPNIEKVDIAFSPFWVTNGPSVDKITITFNVVKK